MTGMLMSFWKMTSTKNACQISRQGDENMSKITYYEFTDEIPSPRPLTWVGELENHDEREAKAADKVTCKNCRHFGFGCEESVGRWHKTCKEFQWD